MQNFSYYNPTRILFGQGQIAAIASQIPADAKVLVTFGGGSIKKNGVYDQVKAALKDHAWLEFGGIEPNPRYETLMQAVALVKREGVDFLLAVGGGSVADGTKFIAAAAHFEGADPWDMLAKRAEVKRLVITHVPPWFNRDTQAEGARRTYPGDVQLAIPRSS